MFKRVIVGSDLSPASDHVIGCLHGLRPLGTEQVILTHALGIRYLVDLKYELGPLAEPKLKQQKHALDEQGFQVEIVIATGMPAWEINRGAREEQASMIVIGSHGATLAREILLGSVAVEVVHRAEVPVFIFQLRITDEAEHRCEMICSDFREHVLFPTDFSDNAERALDYVEHVVRRGCRQVTLLHVQDKARITGHLEDTLDEFNRIDRERLERIARRLKEVGAGDVRIELPYGLPKQEIVRIAERDSYSLIVMGTQGRGFFGDFFVGGVAQHVARHTVVPTLLVPPIR